MRPTVIVYLYEAPLRSVQPVSLDVPATLPKYTSILVGNYYVVTTYHFRLIMRTPLKLLPTSYTNSGNPSP